ncbi:hypothetical protein AC1031_004238 [Aphanomyces cochlioides]|nr:hypothetical protein AC1031_004238 [Aphanomyces cochlioides]
MLLELKLPQDMWPSLIPVVQHALNHTPSSKLNGVAPITAMTQLPQSNALSSFLANDEIKEISAEQLEHWRQTCIKELSEARENLHRQLASSAAEKRDKERNRRNNKKGVRQIRLSIGDYVLVGKVTQSFAAKLQVQWLGPRRIVDTLSDWIYHVEDLRDKTRTLHHISRLKLFAAFDLDVIQDLLDNVAYVEGGHLVEQVVDCRFDRQQKSWMILVKWFGLDEIEKSCFLDEKGETNPNVRRLRAVVKAIEPRQSIPAKTNARKKNKKTHVHFGGTDV